MAERRKFVRFQSPFCVRYLDEESSHEISGVIKDISYGGVKVYLDTSLHILPSKFVSVSIFFPETTLKVLGKVAWVENLKDKKEVGICFLRLPDTHKETIYNNIFKYFRKEFTQKWWQS